jgi:hypothetical protein
VAGRLVGGLTAGGGLFSPRTAARLARIMPGCDIVAALRSAATCCCVLGTPARLAWPWMSPLRGSQSAITLVAAVMQPQLRRAFNDAYVSLDQLSLELRVN